MGQTDNGADATRWALAHHVMSVSLRRIDTTGLRVTMAQFSSIRNRITVAIGAA